MFESLSDRLGKIFDGIRGRGALSAADVDAAMREIRRALIEADVSLEVVRAFVEQVRVRAIGAEEADQRQGGIFRIDAAHQRACECHADGSRYPQPDLQ